MNTKNRSEAQASQGTIDGLKWRKKAKRISALAACRACGFFFENRLVIGLSEVDDVEAYGTAFIEAALGDEKSNPWGNL